MDIFKTNTHSDFWMDSRFERKFKSGQASLPELISLQKSVTNFVNILCSKTGKRVPNVKYSTGNESYTDGTTITLSSKFTPKTIDSQVGLALHEASHIVLTDFNVLKMLCDGVTGSNLVYGPNDAVDNALEVINASSMNVTKSLKIIKDLLNIIEDRRIDKWVMTNAPGYASYYDALYDRYFKSKKISKYLKSDKAAFPDPDNYVLHICNMINPAYDCNALPGLSEIDALIDLVNIDRLKSTSEALSVAVEVFKIIEANAVSQPQPPEQDSEGSDSQEDESQAGEGSDSQDSEGNDSQDNDSQSEEGSDSQDSEGNESEDGEDTESENSKGNESEDGEGKEEGGEDDMLSEMKKAFEEVMKDFEEQKEFINGKIKKVKLHDTIQSVVDTMIDSRVKIHDSTYRGQKVPTYYLDNLTEQMIRTLHIDHITSKPLYTYEVASGFASGKVLAKKLKARSEERVTDYNRLRKGKIDGRRIAYAGLDREDVFKKKEVTSYNPSIVYISIDNSGSMGGKRIQNAIKMATAIAVAFDSVPNMDCVIITRTDGAVESTKNRSYMMDRAPMSVKIYDSRVNGLNHLKKMMSRIATPGGTPEGLCHETIFEYHGKESKDKDAYFINISDGAPGTYITTNDGHNLFYYGDKEANQQTKAVMDKFRKNGWNVISYMVGKTRESQSGRNFIECYGKDSQFIENPDNMMEIAKSLNKKLTNPASANKR